MQGLNLSPLAYQLLLDCATPSDETTSSSALHKSILARTRQVISRLFEDDGAVFGDTLDEITLQYLDRAIAQLEARSGRLLPGLYALETAEDPVGRGVALLAWFSTLGIDGEWRLDLPEPRQIYIGVQQIHLYGNSSVQVNGENLSVRSALGRADFVRVGNGIWRLVRREPVADLARHVIVFHADNPMATPGFAEHLPLAASLRTADDVAHAIRLVLETSPLLHAWLEQAVGGVICLAAPSGNCASGSSLSYPGLVFVTHPIHAENLAVLLVHEASHIYFNALSQHVQLVLPDTTETIYSPFRRMQRPVDKVLLAFHAAANIVRYTSCRRQQGVTNPVLEYEHRTTLEHALSMHADLSKTSTLTPTGVAFLAHTAAYLSSN